ncbi:MAG: hypothetical protein B6242_12000 [Anaerolineaceae bacterium 4572_78]|nr:MAG: hypothetical protein B6242_12000 [Anaerolineaceae bacterium 4572_78]
MTTIPKEMPNSQLLPRVKRSSLATALIITRREIRDSFRDWRIMAPIFILTLIFPALMNATAVFAMNWIAQFGGEIIIQQLIPFLLLVVGFFPMSFSLVIALEVFVGEKERNSIEPLLSMPITDLELYIGKMLGALFVPLSASYLGILVYMTGLFFTVEWSPDVELIVQILVLTTMQGLVMVAGAVVVSSQTTSVRAANLLASFIIIPMALLLQLESALFFWWQYDVIWYIILALTIVVMVLVRMGIRIFNREEILSKEIDILNPSQIWHDVKGYFLRPPEHAMNRTMPSPTFNLKRILLKDIPFLLRSHAMPLVVTLIVFVAAIGGGIASASLYPIPPDRVDLSNISQDSFGKRLGTFGAFSQFRARTIFSHNLRIMTLSPISAIFSFGTLALMLLILPMSIVGYFIGAMGLLGYNPLLFFITFFLPHGTFEIPAMIICTTFALRIGAAMMSPPEGLDIGQGLIYTITNFVKIYIFVVIPLLFISSMIETRVTPWIIYMVYSM